jgi:hypothetical protein
MVLVARQLLHAPPLIPQEVFVSPDRQTPLKSQQPEQVEGPHRAPDWQVPPPLLDITHIWSGAQTLQDWPPLPQYCGSRPFTHLGGYTLLSQQPTQLSGPHSGAVTHWPFWQVEPQGQVTHAFPPTPHELGLWPGAHAAGQLL